MKIEREEIDHLAEMSKLSLEEKEIEKLKSDLEEIVGFFDVLKQASIEGGENAEMVNVSETFEDGQREDLGTDKEGEQFLETKDEFLKIPKVFE